MGNRSKRINDLMHGLYLPQIYEPDPLKDFGMYKQMDAAFSGLSEYLDELRRNQGSIGYKSQNMLSDLSKSYIEAIKNGDEEEACYLHDAMQALMQRFEEAAHEGALAEVGNKFSRTMWQEQVEAEEFGKIWPVITGKSDTVPKLKHWQDFAGNVQAFLYGYLDLVSELAKALNEELSKDMTSEVEFTLFERYLAIAESITLRLSQERHVPGYVINNGYGRWMAYTEKLRTAYGCIAHVRRDYNLRRSIQRMIRSMIATTTKS